MVKTLVILALAAASTQAEPVTPYSCSGLAPGEQQADVDPAVVRPWRALATMDVDAYWLSLVHSVAGHELPVLDTAARVRLQHQLLLVAQKLDLARDQTRRWRQAHASVIALIRKVAPTREELAELGGGSQPAVSAILGPVDRIVQRATSTCGSGNSIHVYTFGGLLAFRPLRTGSTRALVSQLVAIDRAGQPYVTPLVEGIELRFGNAVSAPACVVRAGDDGVLRSEPQHELVEMTPYVQRRGEGVGCVGCHRSENAMNARDLTALEVAKVDLLRDRQVETLMTALWQRLTRFDRPGTRSGS